MSSTYLPLATSLSQEGEVAVKPFFLPKKMLAAIFDRRPPIGSPSMRKQMSPKRQKPTNMQAANANRRSENKKQYEDGSTLATEPPMKACRFGPLRTVTEFLPEISAALSKTFLVTLTAAEGLTVSKNWPASAEKATTGGLQQEQRPQAFKRVLPIEALAMRDCMTMHTSFRPQISSLMITERTTVSRALWVYFQRFRHGQAAHETIFLMQECPTLQHECTPPTKHLDLIVPYM